MSLVRMMNQQWRDTQDYLDQVRVEIRTAALQERAEVAASVPIYATVGDLPTGYLGAVAAVDDDGFGAPALVWHDGTSWVQVAP